MNHKTRIMITGIVQGVGFRPFVYHLAHKYNLKGFCLNNSQGVLIEVQGEMIDTFIQEIKTSPPPLSRIEKLTSQTLISNEIFMDFCIRENLSYKGDFTLLSPDISICRDCIKELLDSHDRRYHYPFINCTHCGPRYSIIRDVPYDRSTTTMASFALCRECESEYHDPANRRFHAQPNACSLCGPKVWFVEKGERCAPGSNVINYPAIQKAKKFLREGAIIAIKGLGGFHLSCDATNNDAVKRLRERKRRPHKPFAIMAPDTETVRMFCFVSEEEKTMLEGRIRPIVILRKIIPSLISDTVAPHNKHLGVMLPYTPLHYLLFNPDEIQLTALVMTSGNQSEEPIVVSNDEAIERLSSIADCFLLHDRDIHMRIDDSIIKARVLHTSLSFTSETQKQEYKIQIIRRARGFVPEAIDLGEEVEEILACGAELKNTFCLTKGRKAILSQHIGDLQNYDTLGFFQESLKNLTHSFRVIPRIIAHDLHPDYLSTRCALEHASQMHIPQTSIIPVQHHHAHIVSCMTEHNLNRKVIGVVFDGTGYGPDEHIWGGEFLVADRQGFLRKAHLEYIPMPGGEKAIKEPWRMAVAYLYHIFHDEIFDILPGFLNRLNPKDIDIIIRMIKGNINTPLTSSAGRLFDTVSSLLGIRDSITFEGEAALELEMKADYRHKGETYRYPFTITGGKPLTIDLKPLIRSITEDSVNGVETALISFNFHDTLAELILQVSNIIKEENGVWDVILSGGVFQNELLLNLTTEHLTKGGFTVWCHEKVPSNDGGISLGQAVVAWEKIKTQSKTDF
ncbi:MAG: carbamoyltransferase HypF [wastewater metagenome]|nr:carbamoyltransferase HypF [Candidatus Loosdrechtia aerotolerans]